MKNLKRITSITIVTLCCLVTINAQNSNPWPTTNFVGIGTVTPVEGLHVSNSRNIRLDVSGAGESYMIGADPVLWHNDEITNIFVGVGIGANLNNAATSNTFVGWQAGEANTSGSTNTFIGANAGESNTTGDDNTFIGHIAGNDNTTGMDNVFIGHQSGPGNTTGSFNLAFGFNAGSVNTTGSNNLFIGRSANVNTSNLTNATAIGSFTRVDASNSMVLGSVNGINGATANTRVGIGATAPSTATKLHVENNADRWIGAFFSTTGGTGSSAIGAVGASRGATRANIGVIGEAAHPVSFFSVLNLLGVFGPKHNVGVVGRAQGASINFGGIFEAEECPSTSRNYGIYAAARRICNNTSSNQVPNSAAGYFSYRWVSPPTVGFSHHCRIV